MTMRPRKLRGYFCLTGEDGDLYCVILRFPPHRIEDASIITKDYKRKGSAKKAAIEMASHFGVSPEQIEWMSDDVEGGEDLAK